MRTYSRTLATITPKLIADAVEEFITVRKPKARAADGKRSQLSPVYALHGETWLRKFAKTFPGHFLGDLNRDFLPATRKPLPNFHRNREMTTAPL